jgi:hypothetical protein
MTAMRILCISPCFPPLADTEAICGGKMVAALMDGGVEVVVLSDPGTYARHGVGTDPSSCWERLRGVTHPLSPPERDNPLALVGLGVRYRTWRIYPRWIHLAVKGAKSLHCAKPFDWVYSRSLPMAAHIAGYWCARALGVRWAANINDPWDHHHYPGSQEKASRLHQALSRHWLRATLRTADVVTYPCSRMMRFNEDLAGMRRGGEVVPHVGMASSSRDRSREFLLVHAGRLPRNEPGEPRAAAGLLAGLKRFLDARPDAHGVTRLRFVGATDADAEMAAREPGIAGVVQSVGRVSYAESLDEIAKAAACVVVERQSRGGIFLPAKFVDYVAAGKPVLALSPAVGTIADMLPEPGIVRCDVNDSPAIGRAIEGLYDDFRAGRLGLRAPSERLAREFTPASAAQRFLSALDRAGIRPSAQEK